MRQPLIAGNWKMNGTRQSTQSLLNGLISRYADAPGVEFIVFPPFPYLVEAQTILSSSPIRWGAQTLSDAETGAMTGDVSLSMLQDLGCQYVILGHSERRQYCGVTSASVAKRAERALAAGVVPVVCVGETLEQYEAGKTLETVQEQLAPILSLKDNLPTLSTLVIAYEPVWAIGTGKTATPEQADKVHAAVRASFDAVDSNLGCQIRILYGGSVKPGNARALFAMPNIDGALVGGASLDVEQFIAIGQQWNKS